MTLVKAKKNGDLIPKTVSDLFETDFLLRPSIFDFSGGFSGFNLLTTIPSTNITETDKDYKIELAAPGLSKQDFKIEIENEMLTISSEKKEEKKEEKENYWKQEFSYQTFSRSFRLPDNSLPDKMEAKYEDGILRLSLPKKDVTTSKSKKEIKVS